MNENVNTLIQIQSLLRLLTFIAFIPDGRCTMNSTKNETCVHIVFNKMDEAEFAGMVGELQSHAAVKEISRSDGSEMKAAENEK